jgi:GTP-binding protein
MVTFRREKYIPYGGPAGGDGGDGGDVILYVDPKLNSLTKFEGNRHYRAADGVRGGSSNRTGASGTDFEIAVPPGTVVREAGTGDLLADLTSEGQHVVVASGGRGGRGNARFKSSTNQAPRMAEKGEPGQERTISLELKLIADVGIVGMPNAGKSTLLSVVSAAKPKIAAYPFTTTAPNLGVVRLDDHELVLADIPGLIEGAHQGIGLGHAFLRHVQRTRLLIHLLDGSSEDPVGDFIQINSELALFDSHLADKPQIVALNKMDLPEAQKNWPAVEKVIRAQGYMILPIAAVTQQGVRDLLLQTLLAYSRLPDDEEPADEVPVFSPREDESTFEVNRVGEGLYRVSGKRIERAAAQTYWEYEEAVMRFQRILGALGITEALRAKGVQTGDTVMIGEYELEWAE